MLTTSCFPSDGVVMFRLKFEMQMMFVVVGLLSSAGQGFFFSLRYQKDI